MNERERLIEQCLADAEKGYLVDESMMSWLKGKVAGAGKHANTAIGNAGKNIKAGYKNMFGKLAGGKTHEAAKQEASDIKSTRKSHSDATAYGNKVDRATRIKEAGAKREKAEAKNAKKLQKLASKALDAVQAYVDAGGKIMHGRTSSVKTTIKSLKAAAGINDENQPAPEPQAAPETPANNSPAPAAPAAPKPGATKIDDIKKGVTVKKQPAAKPAPLKKKPQSPAPKKEKKTADVSLTPVDNVNPHSAEWEEEVNHSVTNVHESSKHYNTAAQLQMLNSIR